MHSRFDAAGAEPTFGRERHSSPRDSGSIGSPGVIRERCSSAQAASSRTATVPASWIWLVKGFQPGG